MGTSIKNTGPKGVAPLVPSWLEPAGDQEGTKTDIQDNPAEQKPPPPDSAPANPQQPSPGEYPLPELPSLPPPGDTNRFRGPTARLNSAARSGASGGAREVRRAVADYVRGSHGGGRGVGRRMSNSTRIAGNIVGFAQAINSQGYNAAIKQFGLQSLVGKPIQEAAGILIDAFTGPGVTTDDNIARDAWCEAVKEIIGKGITDFATLTPAQWAEAVETFLCQAIELRILNEIGNEIVCIATDIARVDQIEEDIKIIIRDGFEGKLAPLIEDGQARSTSELQQCVNEIVGQAADYIEALGEDEKEEE